MKKSLIIAFGLILAILSLAQGQSIQWTSLEHLDDSIRMEQRPLLVFIHTNWWKYCKMQENITFKDPATTKLLNERFYCLKINAESKEDLFFLNRTHQFNPESGYHELADMLGTQNEELIFPTTVLLGKGMQGIKRLTGYQSSQFLKADLAQFL